MGKAGWIGPPDDLHTACGCYPSKESKKSMITKPSNDEKVQSILDARDNVANYLNAIGKIEAFDNFTRDDICGLIRAAHDGVQDSLKRQCASGFSGEIMDDEIPF